MPTPSDDIDHGAGPGRSPPASAELPEVQWIFRRIYTYGLTLALIGLLAIVVRHTTDQVTLQRFGLALCALLALQQLMYVGGATLTDLWELVSAVRTKRIITTGSEATPK